jgi:SAM-dependent methyltransferase
MWVPHLNFPGSEQPGSRRNKPVAGTATLIRTKIKSSLGSSMWLRYAALAPYRVLCSLGISIGGATSSGHHSDMAETAKYVGRIFNEYKFYAGVDHFHGRAAEVGPGDLSGVGLRLLADGCEHVDLADRFKSKSDPGIQDAVNRTILSDHPKANIGKLARHYGESAAAETFFRANKGYDFIFSCAVLEHVYDPIGSLRAMSEALNPGGTMVHIVDCRDHGQFSDKLHDLSFLRLPKLLYRPLGAAGGPNRIRCSAYVNAAKAMGMSYKLYVTALAGIPELLPLGTTWEDISPELLTRSQQHVAEIRNKLAKPFRSMSDDDLMIVGFALVTRSS